MQGMPAEVGHTGAGDVDDAALAQVIRTEVTQVQGMLMMLPVIRAEVTQAQGM